MEIVMTKTQVKYKLNSEGVSCAYSGKNKTWYVDKEPSAGLKADIEMSGFKVEKSLIKLRASKSKV